MNPIEWMSKLQESLRRTQCKISGQENPIEIGFNEVVRLLKATRAQQKNLWWVGNGGSAAICIHLSQDALNKLNMKSMVLADASLITCMSNDYGYENVYCRPLKTLASEGDMLIAISSSGNSKNIVSSVELAHEKSMKVVSLSSFEPSNKLWNMTSDVAFYLPTHLYGIAEVGHETLLHAILETMMLQDEK